jgi:hypothetical protein
MQPGSSSTARYGYDAGNKRVWRGDTGVDEYRVLEPRRRKVFQEDSGGLKDGFWAG